MIPSPTIILATALGFVLATGGAYVTGNLQGRKAADNIWQAKVAEQKVEAANQLAAAYAAKAEKEREDADNARRIDEAHKADMAAADAERADFDRRLREARRRASCSSTGGTEAPNTSVSENVAPGGIDRPGSPDPGNRLREAALELQRYARACHSWAHQVGR